MMTYSEAVDVVEQLIRDKGRGFEWGIYKRFRYDISEDAKHLAIKVLEDPSNTIMDPKHPGKKISILEALRRAIGLELGCNVHRDYTYRVLALVLDDDDNGQHITKDRLLMAKAYRMNVLGMAY
ncbi:MAG: hypothetical protein IKZ94_01180 [Lachnospiraceae bacterium]|nr:hypothetical protein [Lachnospiraceae bacterium]